MGERGLTAMLARRMEPRYQSTENKGREDLYGDWIDVSRIWKSNKAKKLRGDDKGGNNNDYVGMEANKFQVLRNLVGLSTSWLKEVNSNNVEVTPTTKEVGKRGKDRNGQDQKSTGMQARSLRSLRWQWRVTYQHMGVPWWLNEDNAHKER